MSRKENCWDNDEAELFSHLIKTQLIHHCKSQNVNEAEQALFFLHRVVLQPPEEAFYEWVLISG